VQTVLKMENNMRFGGHNMGPAPRPLGAVMKAVKAAIVDYATNCAIKPGWWTKEGGGGFYQAKHRRDFRPTHNTWGIMHDRSS
jgi:hypothetical protein